MIEVWGGGRSPERPPPHLTCSSRPCNARAQTSDGEGAGRRLTPAAAAPRHPPQKQTMDPHSPRSSGGPSVERRHHLPRESETNTHRAVEHSGRIPTRSPASPRAGRPPSHLMPAARCSIGASRSTPLLPSPLDDRVDARLLLGRRLLVLQLRRLLGVHHERRSGVSVVVERQLDLLQRIRKHVEEVTVLPIDDAGLKRARP